LLPGKPT